MNEIIKKGKNDQIQAIRAILCFMIVFYHFTLRYYQIYGVESIFSNDFVYYLSPFGVNSFFIISGFFLLRRSDAATTKGKVLYWLKRFLNIYLPYLLAIIIIYLLSFFNLYGEQRTVSFSGFLQNVIFLNTITGVGYVDGAHWYVVSLLFVYFLAFVHDLLFNKNGGKNYVFWIIVLFISFVCWLSVKCFSFFNDDLRVSYNVLRICAFLNSFLCQGRFAFVFIGLCLFLFDYNDLRCRKNVVLLIALALSLVVLALDGLSTLIIAVLATAVILLALYKKLKFLEKIKPLVFIGNASFAVYLLHQNIGYMFLNLLNRVFPYYLSLVIAIAIVLALGIAFSIFVEKPIKQLTSKICSNKKSKTA